jgi:hypothetical protein
MNRTDQLLGHIINKQHSDAKELFNSLIREKILDRIQEKKVAIASKMVTGQ